MDPVTIIVTAVVAGVAAAAKPTAEQAVKDAYAGLRALILRKFGDKRAVTQAVGLVEDDPEAAGRQEMLKGELAASGAGQDAEVLQAARDLLALVQPRKAEDRSQVATADRGSAAATGRGAATVGSGNITLTGDVQGGVTISQPPPPGEQE